MLARPGPSSGLLFCAILLTVATASTRARLQNAFLTIACVVGAPGLLELVGDFSEPIAPRDLDKRVACRPSWVFDAPRRGAS